MESPIPRRINGVASRLKVQCAMELSVRFRKRMEEVIERCEAMLQDAVRCDAQLFIASS